MALTCKPCLYTPEWRENAYVDTCPFERGQRRETPYFCKCRHKMDLFYTWSEFQSHIKHKYHTTWLLHYESTIRDDVILLNKENKELKRENAILHAKVETLEARLHKCIKSQTTEVYHDAE